VENIFFDQGKLKSCGKNVVIGKTANVRYPELVEIGDNCRIDDFTYISTALKLTRHCHIATHCSITGGRNSYVEFGDFSGLAPAVNLVAASENYRSAIPNIFLPLKYREGQVVGKIMIADHCVLGTGSTVLPNVTFQEGSILGANALVLSDTTLDAWTIYVGNPARAVAKKRDREHVLMLAKEYYEELKG